MCPGDGEVIVRYLTTLFRFNLPPSSSPRQWFMTTPSSYYVDFHVSPKQLVIGSTSSRQFIDVSVFFFLAENRVSPIMLASGSNLSASASHQKAYCRDDFVYFESTELPSLISPKDIFILDICQSRTQIFAPFYLGRFDGDIQKEHLTT